MNLFKRYFPYGSWQYVILMFVVLCIVAFWLLFNLAACNPSKKLQKLERNHPELFKSSVKDSNGKVQTKYVTHDSLIPVPAVTYTSYISVPCPEAKKFKRTAQYKGGYATLIIDSDKATIICHDDSLNELIHWQSEVIDSNTYIIKNLKATAQVKAAPTWWQTTQMRAGDILLILILAALIYGAIKLYLKFKS